MSERAQAPARAAKAATKALAQSGGILQRKCACGGSASLSEECGKCADKRLTVQRHAATPDAPPPAVPAAVHDVLRSSGRPLEASTRALMETRFGHDFGRIRVHTDSRAADSARDLDASAYTVGRHIVFADGQYQPGADAGRRLLAHELSHTLQQEGAAGWQASANEVSSPGDPAEREADRAADAVLAGRDVGELSRVGPRVHRQPSGAARFTKGMLVVTNRDVDMASGLGGDPGVKRVKLLTKGALLKLGEPHPRGGGQVFYATVMKSATEEEPKLVGVVRTNWVEPAGSAPPAPAATRQAPPAARPEPKPSAAAAAASGFRKGQLVTTNRDVDMASDLGGEPGVRPVKLLAKGSMLRLGDPHPKGGGQVFYATAMKSATQEDPGVVGVVRTDWVQVVAPPEPEQPKEPPKPAGPTAALYVDNFKEVIYDMEHRLAEDLYSPTNWLQVKYDDGTAFDINIYSFDEKASASDTAKYLREGKVGMGGRFFPGSLNQYTTPRLWAAREEAIDIAAESTINLMTLSMSAVMFVITIGLPAPNPASMGGGMGSPGRLRATRTQVPKPPPGPAKLTGLKGGGQSAPRGGQSAPPGGGGGEMVYPREGGAAVKMQPRAQAQPQVQPQGRPELRLVKQPQAQPAPPPPAAAPAVAPAPRSLAGPSGSPSPPGYQPTPVRPLLPLGPGAPASEPHVITPPAPQAEPTGDETPAEAPSAAGSPGASPAPAPKPGTTPAAKPDPFPEVEEERKKGTCPTGLSAGDPIKMVWLKPFKYYKSLLKLYGGDYSPFIPTKLLYAEKKFGKEKSTIGVKSTDWPLVGSFLHRVKTPRNKKVTDDFIEATEDEGFGEWKQYSPDHVLDLFFEGQDHFKNLWPLDRGVNERAGFWHANQNVCFSDAPGLAPRVETLNSASLYNRWFVIRKIAEPPPMTPWW